MYRITDAGVETEYFNIVLEDVLITSVTPSFIPTGVVATHLENIEMRYKTIMWKYIDGNVQFKDSWNEYMRG